MAVRILALALLATCPFLLSVVSSQPSSGQGCIAPGTFDPSVNYFSTAFADEAFVLPISLDTTVRNAFNFSVQYKNSYKIVHDTHANTTYLLYLCGAPNPASTAAVPSNGAFPVPLEQFGIITDVPASYLQLLGVVGSLAKVTSGPVVDACMQKVEASLKLAPAFKGPMIDGLGPAFAGTPQYGYPNISFSATQDPGALSRAEWIKYIALFFNREELAESVFRNISDAYQCLNGSAPASEAKPAVAWLSFFDGAWTLSGARYKMEFVADAGGANLPEAAEGDVLYNMSKPTDVASFKAMLAHVDVVIDETYLPQGPEKYSLNSFTTNAGLTPSDLAALPFLRTKPASVWSIYGTYAPQEPPSTAWYESAVSQPQVVLEELLAILHPSMFPQGLDHTFLYNIDNGTPKKVTAADCKASDPAARVLPTPVACASMAETSGSSPPSSAPPGKGASERLSLTGRALPLGLLLVLLLV